MLNPRSRLSRFLRRNRSLVAVALVATIASSGTAAAATALFLGTTNTASATTRLQSSVNGTVFQVTNTNATGGTSAKGIGITVPAGRSPITVNSTAGKATNLNADKLDGIDSSGFVKKAVQAWREVGAAGEPAFGQWCSAACFDIWSNYGSEHNTAAFYKDPLGVVRLKGLVSLSGSLSTSYGCDRAFIFILPIGYRPARITIAPTLRNSAPARVDIMPNGYVMLCGPFTLNQGDWWLLDGISFRAAQ